MTISKLVKPEGGKENKQTKKISRKLFVSVVVFTSGGKAQENFKRHSSWRLMVIKVVAEGLRLKDTQAE